MLCSNCSKLLFTNFNKKCIKCQGAVLMNLYVLCDNCSSIQKQCAVCLKSIQSVINRRKGCGCKKI